MDFILELLLSAFIVIAGFFSLVGSFGLLKLPDVMTRLHAPTKATTLGVGGILIASILYNLLAHGGVSVHELAITLFLFITAPITANFIAKAHMHLERKKVQDTLPDPAGKKIGWSTYDTPHRQTEG
ncbi:Na+/H+ antiporter subunit G [Oceanibaculum nanhaiense]|jgi:multicomponent K+:H+ antiporter subunit G|uniref:Na+/H+ antiporter subunit G n=1 Tax=Oceanibaculum nanhaiense TaxID=1909734 RepID=UPI0025A474B1|nr:Na+/H+ antiporter subunit G [Oceanibaculum nanhaiense]MDM7947721.1 Na+/H+ antiporter subunit G [Oceanibaculum nanhaiense]